MFRKKRSLENKKKIFLRRALGDVIENINDEFHKKTRLMFCVHSSYFYVNFKIRYFTFDRLILVRNTILL